MQKPSSSKNKNAKFKKYIVRARETYGKLNDDQMISPSTRH